MVLDPSTGPTLSLRRRAARLGRATAILTVTTLILLGLAVWLLWNAGPERPVFLPFGGAGLTVFLAVGAIVAATFVGLAALETATVMRVLSPDRRLPHPLPAGLQGLRHLVLAPAALRSLDVERPPQWPLTAIPEPGELPPAGARLRCRVLIPAHDEEAVIADTLRSLKEQRRPPDEVLVIADNCSDATVAVAMAAGAQVVETVGNTEKKAGALNQQLGRMLSSAGADDVFLIMDADSTIAPAFLEVALGLLESDPDLMAVGGLFYGESGGRLVGQFQRNEFSRYARLVSRRLNRVFVLTGTASVVRAYALRAVAHARGSLLPGPLGQVYDTLALTEDNELTFALRTLGARMTSPPQCRVTTEIMTSWRDLWRQRLRWQRGALENLGAYGLTRATTKYWGQQFALSYGVLALYSFFLLTAISLLAADTLLWSPFWVAMGCIFFLERLVTVWAAGWRPRLLAAPVFPELGYSAFLQASFVASAWQIITRTNKDWNYVPRPPAARVSVLIAGALVLPQGILLPTTILYSSWYQALSLWVGFNTVVFAFLSVLQLLPPLRRTARLGARQARRAARDERLAAF